jgi:hypothetical protein
MHNIIYLMLYIFLAVTFYTLVLFPATAQSLIFASLKLCAVVGNETAVRNVIFDLSLLASFVLEMSLRRSKQINNCYIDISVIRSQ